MGARELLSELKAAGISLMSNGQRIEVWPASKLTGVLRDSVRTLKADLLIELHRDRRPYRLTQQEADLAHADPWDGAAIARFEARTAHLRRLRFSEQDADDLAERLHLRDVHADYRHLCVECRHYRQGRCSNHEAAALSAAVVGLDLAVLFQDCAGFVGSPNLGSVDAHMLAIRAS